MSSQSRSWELLRPRRRLLLPLLTASLLVAGSVAAPTSARAADAEVEGLGFRLRLPDGFRPASSRREDDFEEQSFRRRLDGDGTLTLTIAGRVDESELESEMEMELARSFDRVEGLLALAGAEAETHPARVTGAGEAHETRVTGEDGRQHVLTARRGTLTVTVTLDGPLDDDHFDAAWNRVLASLELVEPGTSATVWILVALGLLAAAAVGLTLRRRSLASLAPPTEAPHGRFERRHAGFAPAEEPAPFEPRALPASAPVGRGPGGGLSRADDGLPVYADGEKRRGLDAPRAPQSPSRRHHDSHR
jgi:hypothetical protein